MEIRKILGGVSIDISPIKYGIGKLKNGKYAVGHLVPGQKVHPSQTFDTLDAAYDHWFETLPSYSSNMKCCKPVGTRSEQRERDFHSPFEKIIVPTILKR